MNTQADVPEGTHVNALSEELKLKDKIETAIAEGISLETIGTFLAHLDMAEQSSLVDEMRIKLIAARDQLMN